MRISLSPQLLIASDFSNFGNVIQTNDAQHFSMNAGKLERYYDLADIEVGTQSGGRPVISIAECKQITDFPCEIRFLERHPHGSQAIYPLCSQPMMIVVAPIGESISPKDIRAFYTNGQQGINFHAGVWHAPIMGLTPDEKFIIIDRGGPNDNCEEFYFNETDQIMLLATPK